MGKVKFLFFSLILCLFLAGCDNSSLKNHDSAGEKEPGFLQNVDLKYAREFTIDLYEDGYALIRVNDGNSYVLVPEGQKEYALGEASPTYINMPVDNIYLAASAAMDLFNELDTLDLIKSCSTKASDYSNERVSTRINEDIICYVGKYSAPDYERLIKLNTNLAIESTMIYHSPKIKEELEALGIPVLVERSSYEEHPLGRLEWIKLYGLLTGRYDEADSIFEAQVKSVNSVIDDLESDDTSRPSVVFFYLSSNGYVNVRKPGDYVSRMIEIAGGNYALNSLKVEEENALSTVNISWEDFYVYAKDADILIYNGTIDGGITSTEELTMENSLFEEFKAVKEDRVFCTNNNMYQDTSKIGNIILELYSLINQKDTEFNYLRAVH